MRPNVRIRLIILTLSLLIALFANHIHIYNGLNKGIVIDITSSYSVGFEFTGDAGFFACSNDC